MIFNVFLTEYCAFNRSIIDWSNHQMFIDQTDVEPYNCFGSSYRISTKRPSSYNKQLFWSFGISIMMVLVFVIIINYNGQLHKEKVNRSICAQSDSFWILVIWICIQFLALNWCGTKSKRKSQYKCRLKAATMFTPPMSRQFGTKKEARYHENLRFRKNLLVLICRKKFGT